MKTYSNKSEVEWSSVNQPSGNINCSVYAPCAAVEFVKGIQVNPKAVVSKVGFRLGGNTDKAFGELLGYGVTRNDGYKDTWTKLIVLATSSVWNVPTCLGVGFGKKYKSHHWLYLVGWDEGVVYARDQQNSHRLIEISTKNWKGTVFGEPKKFQCKVKQVGFGLNTRDGCQRFLMN